MTISPGDEFCDRRGGMCGPVAFPARRLRPSRTGPGPDRRDRPGHTPVTPCGRCPLFERVVHRIIAATSSRPSFLDGRSRDEPTPDPHQPPAAAVPAGAPVPGAGDPERPPPTLTMSRSRLMAAHQTSGSSAPGTRPRPRVLVAGSLLATMIRPYGAGRGRPGERDPGRRTATARPGAQPGPVTGRTGRRGGRRSPGPAPHPAWSRAISGSRAVLRDSAAAARHAGDGAAVPGRDQPGAVWTRQCPVFTPCSASGGPTARPASPQRRRRGLIPPVEWGRPPGPDHVTRGGTDRPAGRVASPGPPGPGGLRYLPAQRDPVQRPCVERPSVRWHRGQWPGG